ncbi:FAD-binding domain-containing protein [Coprinellus micaceus]|uniref:FAD-binding domain-containing protein n=1 Tax=Coprinellus micaceus TaxID=71717 RepID=A0A4Y7SD37_COPMI|nr:FAD-binding domain-containing protein [Coprinellus micaceus]
MARNLAFVLIALLGVAPFASATASTQLAPEAELRGSGVGGANYTRVCNQIAGFISTGSRVYYPGDDAFDKLSKHWSPSSSEVSTCVVEPKTASDVGRILKIVGLSRTPFAVQSGGHSTNPGFSSTKGIHISLNNFNTVQYDATSKTAEFGAGLRWDDVYAALEPHGVSVLGGRVAGVGVGGFTLGGGYAWRTNQYGLTIDTATAFELVKPNGDVLKVTEKLDPSLFFALRGGGNNFGVVTKITLRAYPQGQVWGGMITYGIPDTFSAVANATAKFSAEVKDPKAGMMSTVTVYQGMQFINVQVFYDGPAPPAGIFDDLLSITAVNSDVATRSWLELVKSIPTDFLGTSRGAFLGVSVPEYSYNFLELVNNITFTTGAELTPKSLSFMTLVSEPFLPSILSHSRSPAAYPYTRSKVYTPFNIFMAWTDPSQDKVMYDSMRKVKDILETALVAEGHRDVKSAPLYSNYALGDTPISRIYGSNYPALKAIKTRVDPFNVMGLAGGFKI